MADLLAVFLHNIAVTFSPERVILTGSFAQSSDLFLDRTRGQLEKLLARRREGIDLLPVIGLSPLSNHAGLLGGAFIALRNQNR
jgi:predicted NBD/HSP70 family sugar kinase